MEILDRAMPPGEDIGTESKYCGTCRPCCTTPHGPISVTVAAFATFAFLLSLMTTAGCNFVRIDFEYCAPAAPKPGYCGDCFCMAGSNGTCPVGEEVPRQMYYQESVDQWLNVQLANPYALSCNPYINTSCATVPPQQYVNLGETAVCGVRYNRTALDAANQCPTQYETVSFPSLEALLAEGDNVSLTHYGACGVCSSLQDLAVYVQNPDLTLVGQVCGLLAFASEEAATKCFVDAGYTEPCALMWVYDTVWTRVKCADICMTFTISGAPSNGPAPQCPLADCLQCDESYSGPVFQQVAARSRRRSGLLSTISRPCSQILLVNHTDPCPDALGGTATPIAALEPPQPTCTQVDNPAGPLFYASTKTNLLLDISFILSPEQKLTRSTYNTCKRLTLKRATGGYWQTVAGVLGPPWYVSAISVLLATLLGGVAMLLTWSTTCAAFRQNFWTAMTWTYGLAGFFQLLALVIVHSGACPEQGCELLTDAFVNIVAGVLWLLCAILSFLARAPARPGKTIACCCCPDVGGHDNIMKWVPDETEFLMEANLPSFSLKKPVTRIAITETVLTDGSKMVEKVTSMPDGHKIVERTMMKVAHSNVPGESAAEGPVVEPIKELEGSDVESMKEDLERVDL